MAVGGVDPGRDVEPDADTLEQREEVIPLGVAEVLAEGAVVAGREGEGPVEEVAALVGEVEGAGATIAGVQAAFEEPARLRASTNPTMRLGAIFRRAPTACWGAVRVGADGAEEGELRGSSPSGLSVSRKRRAIS
jgi:hypothetical protein